MTMSPWKSLYAMTWLLFLEMMLGLYTDGQLWTSYAHVALGVGLVALAFGNARALRATRVPGRVKRTARSTMQLTVVLALLGALLVFDVGAGWTIALGVTLRAVVVFLHAVLAITVLAQAAATGISYDMWEEKEYLAETEPGEVPALEVPTASTGSERRPGAG